MPKSNRYALETFPPELMDALLAGSRRRYVIPFPDVKLALNFRRMVHMLRMAMSKAGHRDYPLAAKAQVSVYCDRPQLKLPRLDNLAERPPLDYNPDKFAFVVIEPRGAAMVSILKQSGILNNLPPLPASEASGANSVDDFLDELGHEK